MAIEKLTVTMRLAKTTPGALRYQEITAEGDDIEIKNGAKIGTQYIRKSAMDGAQWPKVEITVRPIT